MRSISLFLLNYIEFLDESKLFDYARTGNYEVIKEMTGAGFYIYLSIWVIFIIVFIFVQFKINRNKDNFPNYYKDFDLISGGAEILPDYNQTNTDIEEYD